MRVAAFVGRDHGDDGQDVRVCGDWEAWGLERANKECAAVGGVCGDVTKKEAKSSVA